MQGPAPAVTIEGGDGDTSMVEVVMNLGDAVPNLPPVGSTQGRSLKSITKKFASNSAKGKTKKGTKVGPKIRARGKKELPSL